MTNIFLKSFKESLKHINQHKFIFILLFAIQAVLLIIASALFIDFSVIIGEHLQAFMLPIEESGALSEEQMIAPLMSVAERFEHYNAIIINFVIFIATLFALYIVINGIIWALTSKTFNEKSFFVIYQLKFAGLLLIFSIPFIALVYFTNQFIFNLDNIKIAITFYGTIAAILVYFMYISFGLITEIKKAKEIFSAVKKAFIVGVKKIYIILPILILTTGIPALFIYLIYLALEANFALLTLLLILFVLSVNFGRIAFLSLIKNLEKK